MPRLVHRTSHISFSEQDKTFRLYAGDSIYAFCLSSELGLEHLHWGQAVPPEYDLRYLGESSRATHFNTVDAGPDPFGGKIVLAAETLQEIQRTWRENKVWVPMDMDDQERFVKRRLENYSWRIMSQLLKNKLKHGKTTTTLAGKKFSNALDIQRARSATSTTDNVRGELAAFNSLKKSLPTPAPSQSNLEQESQPEKMRIHRSYSSPDLEVLRSEFEMSEIKDITRNVTHSMGGKDRRDALRKASAFEDAQVEKRCISVHNRAETFERKIGKIGKGGICLEYSDHGTGDFRTPSFVVVDNFNGSSITPLRYRRHRIYKGKLNMPDDMPSIRCASEDEASTLVVTLADSSSGLEVDLIYGRLMHHSIYMAYMACF
ncbi:hypothetical protein EON64_06280 [archaeon]|nr:MAG: hypothetical protein EON64_06280 [archaeon]